MIEAAFFFGRKRAAFFWFVFGCAVCGFFQKLAAWLRINCIFAENMEKNMNSELIIKKRILRENRRSTDNYVLERELRNSVGPEEFRAKLVETVAKRYENVQG